MATRDAPSARVGRRDGHVVEQAEPHRPIAFRMMARRPDQRQGGDVRRGHHPLHRVDGRARGQQRDLVRFGRRIRVRIERRRAVDRLRETAEVLGGMNARELLAARLARRDDLDAPRAPSSGHGVHDLGALGALGMARRRLVFGEAV
jgi:hypothetical protein